MSRMGFRSKAEKQSVRTLCKRGWIRIGRNGMGHERVYWPATGITLIVPGKGPEHFYTLLMRQAAAGEQGQPQRRRENSYVAVQEAGA